MLQPLKVAAISHERNIAMVSFISVSYLGELHCSTYDHDRGTEIHY